MIYACTNEECMNYKIERPIEEDSNQKVAHQESLFCSCGEVLRRFSNGINSRPQKVLVTKVKDPKSVEGLEMQSSMSALAQAILDGKLEEWAKLQL